MSKGRHHDYSRAHRERYQKRFQTLYGMSHIEWAKWKKEHTKEEVHAKREEARRRSI